MPGGNPYVFVVGCPRSGTTLLQRMLDSHPSLAVANDPHFIADALGDAGSDVPLTGELVERVVSYRAFHRLGLTASEAAASAGAATYARFVEALFDALAAKRGKPLAGEKAPPYARYLPLLHALFPQARFVHIVRDGRDVALSTLDWAQNGAGPGRFRLWRKEPLAVCALYWRWHVTTGRRDGAALGDGLYEEVRYERLVAEPERTLQSLASFLDLPFADEMLAYHEGRTTHDSRRSTKRRWLPPTAGLRDWRRELRRDDLELFEALAGDTLSALGYERASSRVSRAVAERARACRTAWEAELRSRPRRPASRLDLAIDPFAHPLPS